MRILRFPQDRKEIERYIERPFSKEKIEIVREIIDSVRRDGDSAILRYTKLFDGVEIERVDVDKSRIEDGYLSADQMYIDAINRTKENIALFQKETLRGSWKREKDGKVVGELVRPIERVGVYVPGGSAPLISSLLMAAVPAKIAGVKEIAVCSPPPIGQYILATCYILDIDEVYQIGGAQAIAAFAFGTESVKRVEAIAGPGNVYVTLAKREVFSDVGIDLLAGPSEIVIVADSSANPEYIASDLKAQAEHGEGGLSLLITESEELAYSVSLLCASDECIAVITEEIETTAYLCDLFAPEHLAIYTEEPQRLAEKVNNAGAIFFGQYSPVAAGDYIAGPSHILPTNRTALFSSGLSAERFQKRISFISYTKDALRRDRDAILLAELEGLKEHKKSLEVRL
jgi:histidinol dehydrogenase